MGSITNTLFGGGAADDAAKAQRAQQAELNKQKQAQQAKEDEMNRRRMADMRAQQGNGFGVQTGKPDELG